MDWRGLGTLLGMLGFLGVVVFGFYVLSSSDDGIRSERLCKPIRDVQNTSYKYFGVVHEDVKEKTRVFPRIIEYLHVHCVDLLAEKAFGEAGADTYRQKDWFAEDLKAIHQLDLDEVNKILITGQRSQIDWRSEQERSNLLNEYFEYKGVRN